MKKCFFALLTATLSCASVSAAVGDTFTSGDFTFTVISENPRTVSVGATDPKTISGDIIIPTTITNNGTTYTVTELAYHAFYYSNLITSVSIPESVTKIGNYAFEACDKIKSITLPQSLNSYGEGALAACSSLTEIITNGGSFYSENGVLYHADKTIIFQYAAGKSDTDFEVPSTVTKINTAAFNGCTNLTSITIPSETTSLGSYILWKCTNITKVVNLNPVPQDIESKTFQNFNKSNAVLCVPSNSKEAYASAEYWNQFKEICGLVWFDTHSATLKVGETINIKNDFMHVESVEVKSEQWSSQNPAVATVSSDGVVTAVADGTTTITLKAVDSNNETYTNEFDVTVDTPAGITFITTDAKGTIDYSAPYNVYTLNGMHAGTRIESLAPGLYIVRQNAASAKILVK